MNRTRRIGPKASVQFRKIDEDCGPDSDFTDIREDANSHKVTQCKYRSRRLCTAVDLSSHLFLNALQPLSFCFPLIAFCLSPFNTTLTPAIRNRCSCFNSLILGVKVSQSEFLICASLHHRLQFFDNQASISSDESMSYNSDPVLS